MINKYCTNLYCSEDISLIENYAEALDDKTQTWDCHHRLEVQGKFRNTPELLKKCGLYYKVPAWQLVFLTKTEHNKLHNIGKECKIETRQKISKANKGKIPWCKGMKGQYTQKKRTEEQRKHSSDSSYWKGKHYSDEMKVKISEATKNAMANISKTKKQEMAYKASQKLKGKRLSEEHKQKLSASRKGLHWWNNGKIAIQRRECPGSEWKRGNLKQSQKIN